MFFKRTNRPMENDSTRFKKCTRTDGKIFTTKCVIKILTLSRRKTDAAKLSYHPNCCSVASMVLKK
jgi:hypothetical protein